MTVTQMRQGMDQWEYVHWKALAKLRKGRGNSQKPRR